MKDHNWAPLVFYYEFVASKIKYIFEYYKTNIVYKNDMKFDWV